MRIRPETSSDRVAIRAVNEAAFEAPLEADLVEALRDKGIYLISLVAEIDGEVVGHALFSPVAVTEHPHVNVMGLGPMAVMPEHQGEGIGSALVREGLERCKAARCHAVVVVGHPEYYSRFGFVPAARYALRSEYDVPADVFMVVELEAGALRAASGLVRYDAVFGTV
jgi:putative acetyltransferase